MIPVKVGDLSLTDAPWDAHSIIGWLDSPGATVESTPRLLAGDFAGASRWSGRTVKLTGLLHTRDCIEQQAARDRLAGLFASGQTQPVRVRHGGVETVGNFQIIDQMTMYPVTPELAEWELSLYAPDPFLYGPEIVTFLHPIGTGVGLQYPLYGPTVNPVGEPVLSYGTGIDAQDPIGNAGNAPAWPTFLVVGDFPSGFQINVGGRVVSWPHPTAPQAPVEVDMSGAIRVGGMDQTHMAARRDWSPVPPGAVIYPTFEPMQAGTGWCEVHLEPAYM